MYSTCCAAHATWIDMINYKTHYWAIKRVETIDESENCYATEYITQDTVFKRL